MSEDFDKEAERERLREKYERDKEDRESTERMSELLLQGATMTNRHCDTCGSPIFRYQGQEFCPNCQMAAGGEQPAQEGSGTGQAGAAENAGATATDSRSDAQQADGQSRHPQQPQPQQPQGQQSGQPAHSRPQHPRQTPTQPSTTPGQQGGATDPAASVPGQEAAAPVDADSLEDTQAALAQTLARFSQLAASTDDPHRAREYLETAKAAAETLRALPR